MGWNRNSQSTPHTGFHWLILHSVSTATVGSARHLPPAFLTEPTAQLILKEGPRISYGLWGIASGMYFLAYSSQWHSPLHCLKPQHRHWAFHLTSYNHIPSQAVSCEHDFFTSTIPSNRTFYCLLAFPVVCLFVLFIIFRKNHTRKNTVEGQFGKTGRSQMVLVVIDDYSATTSHSSWAEGLLHSISSHWILCYILMHIY